MNRLKSNLLGLLRRSETFFKTDMVYMAKGGFWLGIGQVSSALIAFVSSLFFANLISKDIYGNYKYIIAATSILGAFSLTGMGSVVVQGVAQGFEGILKTATKTTLKWGSVIILVGIGTSSYYFFKGNNTLAIALLIASASLPINQAFTLYGNYLMGKKDFKRVTIYGIVSQLLITAAVIVTAILTENILVMVFVYFLFSLSTTLWAYTRTIKIFHINEVEDHTLIPYGKHLSLMGLFGTIANQFDKILVFHYLGAVQLAVYAFSQAIPDQLKGVLKNIFGLAIPKYAALPESELRESISKKGWQLTGLTTLVVIVLIILMPLVFKLLFPKYIEAVLYSQIYMLGLITIPGISLFGIYFQLKKATRKMYELNVISSISTLVITFVLIYKYGLMGAVIANGASWLLMLLAHLYYFAVDSYSSKNQII